ncbi:hypothetical protein FTUN_5189 [Frigoriglobus tundricola]|uniref:Uncharacterized protein n=1 Tax=Frigoriglobus tundricola TaxID=2774151 RepID=A0A6M5YVV9_9BACT|nr:hypothetical protein FTUN_5189 [Frigoriglobus tundricola]
MTRPKIGTAGLTRFSTLSGAPGVTRDGSPTTLFQAWENVSLSNT